MKKILLTTLAAACMAVSTHAINQPGTFMTVAHTTSVELNNNFAAPFGIESVVYQLTSPVDFGTADPFVAQQGHVGQLTMYDIHGNRRDISRGYWFGPELPDASGWQTFGFKAPGWLIQGRHTVFWMVYQYNATHKTFNTEAELRDRLNGERLYLADMSSPSIKAVPTRIVGDPVSTLTLFSFSGVALAALAGRKSRIESKGEPKRAS